MRREISIGIAIEVIGNGTGLGLQMTGVTNVLIGWIIIAVSNAVGIGVIGYGLGKGTKESIPIIAPKRPSPRKRLMAGDWIELETLGERMIYLHGHRDDDGVKADRLDGYTWSEIYSLPCHVCNKPRDKRGD